MTTYQTLYGGTLAYNARNSWVRCHALPYWSLLSDAIISAAVIDDFGRLVIVPMRSLT